MSSEAICFRIGFDILQSFQTLSASFFATFLIIDIVLRLNLIFSYFIFDYFSYLILLRRVALQQVDFQGALR